MFLTIFLLILFVILLSITIMRLYFDKSFTGQYNIGITMMFMGCTTISFAAFLVAMALQFMG